MKMARKSHRYEKMTLRELEPFVAEYHAQFPDWKRTFKEAFGRENGPIAQEIFFERLSYGTYRPASIIRFFVAPSGSAFHQFLTPPARESRPGEHDYKFLKIVEAMHKEIVPSVDGPLIPEDILRRFEQREQYNKDVKAHDLAALNAYLGHEDRALYWCEQFPKLVEARGQYAWQDYDYERLTFLKQLEQWIKTGEVKSRLEEVIQSERKRLKYV
jgi:hypothetical protein